MLAEAAAAAKPLYIYPVPARPAGWRSRLAGLILAASQSDSGALARFCRLLIDRGLAVPPRDLELMHRGMVSHRIARPFGEAGSEGPAAQRPDLAPVVQRVRQLLEQK
jgi:hypothetical protein